MYTHMYAVRKLEFNCIEFYDNSLRKKIRLQYTKNSNMLIHLINIDFNVIITTHQPSKPDLAKNVYVYYVGISCII